MFYVSLGRLEGTQWGVHIPQYDTLAPRTGLS
jgi:hypothetical protein